MAQSSRRTSRSRATIGVSEKRIRDANQTKGEALASQFRPHVRGIEDPRASRGKNKLTGASRNPRLAASVPQSHPTKSSDKASVTPSPKLTLPAIFSRIIAPKLSEVQQSKLYSTSTLTTCHHESQQLPYRSTHAAPLSLIQLTWDEAVPAPLRIQGPAHPPPAHTMGQEVHPAFRSIPTREGSLKRSPQRSNSDYDARFSNSNVSAWNRSKRHQSKSQERAFVHKKDNPFSLYKHDPNDTESYLDRLSSQNKESIIPPEGLKALADASKAQLYSVPVGAVRGNVYRPPHQRGKRDSLGAALSTQELLSQKAAEHNAHMSVVTCAPAFNYDQSRYSQLGNTFDQALHGSAIFYRTMGVQPNNYDSNEVASWASRECNSDFTQNKEHFIRERAPDNFHQNRDELRQYTYEKNGYGYSCAPQPIPVVQGGFHSDFQGAHQPTDLEEKNGSEQPWQPGFTSALYSSEHGFQTVSGRNSRMGYRTDQYQGMNEEDIETAFF